MPTLSITKTYVDGDVLVEADLDNVRNDVQDFVNTTKLDSSNIQTGGLATANYADLSVTTAKLAANAVTKAKIDTSQQLPPGVIMPYTKVSTSNSTPDVDAPDGWLFCTGQTVSRTTYADLYAIIGDTHGNGDGSTTFHLPDYRGRFLRGCDDMGDSQGDAARDVAGTRSAMNTGGNGDGADTVGSVQADATGANGLSTASNGAHTHKVIKDDGTGTGTATSPVSANDLFVTTVGYWDHLSTDSAGAHTHTISSTDNETVPINAFVSYLIKT